MAREAGWAGILLRVVVGVVLVLLTFNPTGWSFHHWLKSAGLAPATALAGALLLCGWVLYVRAAVQSLGVLGVGLLALVAAACVWLLADWGLFDPRQPQVMAWILLVVLGLVLGIGLGWSILRRRLTGQIDVEETPGP